MTIFNSLSFSGPQRLSILLDPQTLLPIYNIFHQFLHLFSLFCLTSFGVVPVFVTSCWHLLQMSTWWPNRSHTRSVANVPMWPRQAGTGECLLRSPLLHHLFSALQFFERGCSPVFMHPSILYSCRKEIAPGH